MQISEAGITLIKGFEGFSVLPYKDGAGCMTIGFGHKVRQGEMYESITEETALELLKDDLQESEDAVNRLVEVELNQNQFDALASFTYNLGAGTLQGSTLLKLLNGGNYQGASGQITRWEYVRGTISTGLSRRREAERALFEKPVTA